MTDRIVALTGHLGSPGAGLLVRHGSTAVLVGRTVPGLSGRLGA